MELIRNGAYCHVWHRETEQDLSNLIRCLQARDLMSLVERVRNEESGVDDVLHCHLTVLIDGRKSPFGDYIAPLFSDFSRDDLAAIHCYQQCYPRKTIIEDSVVPDGPFLVAIVDEDGDALVSLKCDQDGWSVLKFAARMSQIHSLLWMLRRIDALCMGMNVRRKSA